MRTKNETDAVRTFAKGPWNVKVLLLRSTSRTVPDRFHAAPLTTRMISPAATSYPRAGENRRADVLGDTLIQGTGTVRQAFCVPETRKVN